MKNTHPSLKTVPLWTAIITPLDKTGKVDFASLGKLLKNQEKSRNGVVILGSTGEGLALSRAEKESVLKFACELELDLPLIAGVPGHCLEDALDWIQLAKSVGVHGFLSVTPYYAKPGAVGQQKWFEAILNAAELPVMLYNVPSRSGIRLAPSVLTALKNNPYLWALKESSGLVSSLREYQAAYPALSYYCGDDGLMAEFSKEGVKGLVSVASNVWPEATRKIAELCLAQKTIGLEFWPACVDSLFVASNPVPAKWLHYHLGEIATPNTRAPLDVNDLSDSTPILKAHEKVSQWIKERSAL